MYFLEEKRVAISDCSRTGEEKGYLSAASGVLSSPAGNEFGVMVLEKVFIEVHVFFFGQNGIVAFETVFGK